ncbi:glycosyltransferase family 2 protein [Sinorhizobium mexicanum]|uniref:Glycosyltransferase family 2 protein n=1 Tax=Sinorhizobium mexicanum TaxID=375549 RepID=A0A859QT17_9HYPH|nr:glycosyltransferase family 2 protein [Sinorhizobium mexicanum]MBP1887291.1 GT2 family glycosyltransferase [Sinorhizobium mexicanum]QLL65820.1 glycosyltransferase family 2 protein [Sinorhizobium mexicanum]
MDRPQVDGRQRNPAVPEPNEAGSLAVVIVTYNSASVLPGLLDSLPAGLEGIANYQVIVVDNASRDGSADLAIAHPIGAKIIRMGRNAGYAAGINAATATVAPCADLLVLNPDVRLRPGAARQLVDRLAEASVGVVAPQILGEDGKICRSLRREPSAITAWSDALIGTKLAARIGLGEIVADPLLYQQGGRIEWATGAILAISARARRIVGDWDESFFLYSEEVDYMERVRRSALSVVYDTNARAVHIGGAYHCSPHLSALMTANRVRYYRRHHGPIATILFRLAIIVGESMRVVLGPGHRAALRAALTFREAV